MEFVLPKIDRAPFGPSSVIQYCARGAEGSVEVVNVTYLSKLI